MHSTLGTLESHTEQRYGNQLQVFPTSVTRLIDESKEERQDYVVEDEEILSSEVIEISSSEDEESTCSAEGKYED